MGRIEREKLRMVMEANERINSKGLIKEDGWDDADAAEKQKDKGVGDAELIKIGEELYTFFKNEGAKTYLSSKHGDDMGEKEGYQIAIMVERDYIGFKVTVSGMLKKVGQSTLKKYPNLKLQGTPEGDYFALERK